MSHPLQAAGSCPRPRVGRPYTAATTLGGTPLGAGPGGVRVAVHHAATAAAGPLPFAAAAGLLLGCTVLLAAAAAGTTVRADVT